MQCTRQPISLRAAAEKLREKFEEVMDAKLEEESEESEDGDDEKDKELAQKDQVTAEGPLLRFMGAKKTEEGDGRLYFYLRSRRHLLWVSLIKHGPWAK